jgi:hypothetical protein
VVFVRGVSQRRVPMKYVNPQRHDGVLQRNASVVTKGPAFNMGIVDVGSAPLGKTPTVVWALPEMCVCDMDVSSLTLVKQERTARLLTLG